MKQKAVAIITIALLCGCLSSCSPNNSYSDSERAADVQGCIENARGNVTLSLDNIGCIYDDIDEIYDISPDVRQALEADLEEVIAELNECDDELAEAYSAVN